MTGDHRKGGGGGGGGTNDTGLLLCSLLRKLADLSSIHDSVVYSKTLCSLHITHIIIIIVILLFFRGYNLLYKKLNRQHYCLVSHVGPLVQLLAPCSWTQVQ